jgi:hypothetical protein
MAIVIGRHVARRAQGNKQCCWLTCIEMLMQLKEGTIYGKDRDGNRRLAHTRLAQQEFDANKGAHIGTHATEYHLVSADRLSEGTLDQWKRALAKGPVIAEGWYGDATIPLAIHKWSAHKSWLHVILITGVSRSDNLVFVNPNAFGNNWGHVNRWFGGSDSGDSYMTLKKCHERARRDNLLGGPYWQHKDDYTWR